MNLVQLNEVYISTLTESKAEAKRPGVLKTVEGPFAEVNEQNRNGRRYSRKLWETVINSDYVKEMLPNRTLFGEADHPADRAEISLPNVSHVVTNLKLMPDGVVYGKADILDTPSGRILNTLIEYGAKLGVSSRGMGTISEGEGNWVDEENYLFITFDFVPMPSVKRARPGITEGAEFEFNYTPITESLTKQIESASPAELQIIEGVVSQLDENIKNGLEHILLQRKNSTMNSTLLEEEVQHLKASNADYKTSVDRVIKEKTLLESKIVSLEQDMKNLGNSILTKRSSFDQERQSYLDTIRRLKTEVTQLQVENEQYKSVQQEFSTMQQRLHETLSMAATQAPDVHSLKETVQSYASTIDKQKLQLAETTKKYNDLGELTERYVDRNKELVSMVAEVVSMFTHVPVGTVKESLKPKFTLADVYQVVKFYKNEKSTVKLPSVQNQEVKRLNEMTVMNEKKEPDYKEHLENLIKKVRGNL